MFRCLFCVCDAKNTIVYSSYPRYLFIISVNKTKPATKTKRVVPFPSEPNTERDFLIWAELQDVSCM